MLNLIVEKLSGFRMRGSYSRFRECVETNRWKTYTIIIIINSRNQGI